MARHEALANPLELGALQIVLLRCRPASPGKCVLAQVVATCNISNSAVCGALSAGRCQRES